MTGEQNLGLIRQIEANREFLPTILGPNPALLARAEPRIQEMLEPLSAAPARCVPAGTSGQAARRP